METPNLPIFNFTVIIAQHCPCPSEKLGLRRRIGSSGFLRSSGYKKNGA
jgi:hypothetical protein